MTDFKVLVIRQPWAWLIVHGYKDIENRTWKTRYRGALLIQASANLHPKWLFDEGRSFARQRGVRVPEDLEKGRNCGHGPTGGLCHPEPQQMVRGTGRVGSLEGEKNTTYSAEGSARTI